MLGLRRPTGLAAATRRALAAAAAGALLGATGASGEEPATLGTEPARVGYSAGYAFGARLAELERSGTGVEIEAVLRGVLDALAGDEPRLSEAERTAALEALAHATDAAPRTAGAPARRRGFVDDFAALNAKRPGVVVLPSGVQYEVLAAGGGRKPDPGGSVLVSYQGSLADGQIFDSTRGEGGEPVRLRLDEIVVPGLREALLLMREGDRWRVVVPPAMGFARAGNNLLRRRDLIYEIELVSVVPAP